MSNFITPIQHATAAYFNISIEELRAVGKSGSLMSTARHVARYLERQAGRSFPEIATLYGNTDHTAALASVRHMTERLQANDERYVGPVNHIATVVKISLEKQHRANVEADKSMDAMTCPTCGAPVIKELQRQIAVLHERINQMRAESGK